jgi:hypothetical protein
LDGSIPVGDQTEKLALAHPAGDPVAVARVVVLRPAERAVDVRLTQLTKPTAAHVIHAHSYRGGLLNEVWTAELFAWAAAIANRIPVTRVVRPVGVWTVGEVCEVIERLAAGRP